MSVELAARRFQQLESEMNTILSSACARLMSDDEKVAYYSSLFDRTSESGFYASAAGPRGEGEQPTWSPNPAYMDSLEELWIDVEAKLAESGLTLEKTLRELFYLSHEYMDQTADHRRVFHGQLIDVERGKPVTYFMLSIPHSHAGFRYITPPYIQISPSLWTDESLA